MTGIVVCDSNFVDFVKKVLNFSIAFEKVYNEKIIASRILDILKDMIRSELLTGISSNLVTDTSGLLR